MKNVSYSVAMLAKEKGFDVPLSEYYDTRTRSVMSGPEYGSERDVITNWNDGMGAYPTMPGEVSCSAPTPSELQRWLRKEKGLDVNCLSYFGDDRKRMYFFSVEKSVNNKFVEEVFNCISKVQKLLYNDYDEALNDGCKVALESITN